QGGLRHPRLLEVERSRPLGPARLHDLRAHAAHRGRHADLRHARPRADALLRGQLARPLGTHDAARGPGGGGRRQEARGGCVGREVARYTRRQLLARRLPLFLIFASCASAAFPAPNEIKVFTDELASYRKHTLETHVNKARTGPLRVMPEYYYGPWHNWEFSLQLPFAFSSQSANGEGYRAELQYVAPHDYTGGFYWGINAEIARDYRLD